MRNITILYVDDEHRIKKDDLVYTAGDNGLIISGLFVGKISNVKKNKIKVKLFQDIKRVDNVLIVDVVQGEFFDSADEIVN